MFSENKYLRVTYVMAWHNIFYNKKLLKCYLMFFNKSLTFSTYSICISICQIIRPPCLFFNDILIKLKNSITYVTCILPWCHKKYFIPEIYPLVSPYHLSYCWCVTTNTFFQHSLIIKKFKNIHNYHTFCVGDNVRYFVTSHIYFMFSGNL